LIVGARRILLAMVAAALALSSCGSVEAGPPQITEARVGQPTGPNAALYFTAIGYGSSDRLLSVSTEIAQTTAIHETVVGDDGVVSMQPITSLDLPATGDLVLEPGGFHAMLIGVDRLNIGAEVEFELTWEKAGTQTIDATVVDPSDTMGPDMEETGSG